MKLLDKNIENIKWHVDYNESKVREVNTLLSMYRANEKFEKQVADLEWQLKHHQEALEDNVLILTALENLKP